MIRATDADRAPRLEAQWREWCSARLPGDGRRAGTPRRRRHGVLSGEGWLPAGHVTDRKASFGIEEHVAGLEAFQVSLPTARTQKSEGTV